MKLLLLHVAALFFFPHHDSTWISEDGLLTPIAVADQLGMEEGGSAYMDQLLWLQENPYDLNQITFGELLSLPGVTEADAHAIMAFRKEHGRFRTMSQVAAIDGGCRRLMEAIAPYVAVGNGRKNGLLSFRARVERDNPSDDSFVGSPLHSTSRISFSRKSECEVGALFEKDAGEPTRAAYESGYVLARNVVPDVDVIAGDFSLEAGEGLLLWSGKTITKAQMSVRSPAKQTSGLKPHRSAGELNFLRGGGISFAGVRGRERWCALLFYSRRSLPATVQGDGSVSALVQDGSATDSASIARRNALEEELVGARVVYTHAEEMTLGVTAIRGCYDHPIRRSDPLRFAGSRYVIAGMDMRCAPGIFVVFAEGTVMTGGSHAVVTGTLIHAGPACTFAAVFRNYSPGFDNPRGAGFGDNAETRNERGTYFGGVWDATSSLRVSAYFDQYRHPAPSENTPIPVAGDEAVIDFHHEPATGISLDGRFSVARSGTCIKGEDAWGREIRQEARCERCRWKGGAGFRIGRHVSLSPQIECDHVTSPPSVDEWGFLLRHTIRVDAGRIFSVEGRMTIFGTGSYASRVYDVENDLSGLFAPHPLEGKGDRWYLVARIAPVVWCSVGVKYAVTEKEAGISAGARPRDLPRTRIDHVGIQIDVTPP